MIEFIRNNTFEIVFYFMLFLVICSFIVTHIQIKASKKLFKEYKKLADEHGNTLSELLAKSIELASIYSEVEGFVNEHNSWHDRKIAFYYDKDGWHCCYCDEIPKGDIVAGQEEINPQNEKDNENQQSI